MLLAPSLTCSPERLGHYDRKPMLRRFATTLLLMALTAALVATPGVAAGTTGTTGSTGVSGANGAAKKPTLVEPTAGKPVPAPQTDVPATTTIIATPQTTTLVPSTQPTTAASGATGATGATGPQGARGSGGGLSNGARGVIAAGVLLALVLALFAFGRWRGWSSARWRRLRHAGAEASWRMSLRNAEFRDFLRLGR